MHHKKNSQVRTLVLVVTSAAVVVVSAGVAMISFFSVLNGGTAGVANGHGGLVRTVGRSRVSCQRMHVLRV